MSIFYYFLVPGTLRHDRAWPRFHERIRDIGIMPYQVTTMVPFLREMAELASEHTLAYQGNLGALKLRFGESPQLAIMKDTVINFSALRSCIV